MSVRSLLALPVLVLAACGGDDGNKTDASTGMDAPAATVKMVTCPGGTIPTIMTQATSFNPASTTINKNGIIQFVSTATHPIVPFPGGGEMTDPGIVVPEGQTQCLQFTASGTFKFICRTHSYLGTVIVN